jgi:hypothetical protein
MPKMLLMLMLMLLPTIQSEALDSCEEEGPEANSIQRDHSMERYSQKMDTIIAVMTKGKGNEWCFKFSTMQWT